MRTRRRWERLPEEFGNSAFGVTSPFSHAEQFSETRQIYKDYGKVYFAHYLLHFVLCMYINRAESSLNIFTEHNSAVARKIKSTHRRTLCK